MLKSVALTIVDDALTKARQSFEDRGNRLSSNNLKEFTYLVESLIQATLHANEHDGFYIADKISIKLHINQDNTLVVSVQGWDVDPKKEALR